MNDECEHRKIYSVEVITPAPPVQNWICIDCGERGKERGPEHDGSPLYGTYVRYWEERNKNERQ